jgi:ADP-ribosylglycohydrolase
MQPFPSWTSDQTQLFLCLLDELLEGRTAAEQDAQIPRRLARRLFCQPVDVLAAVAKVLMEHPATDRHEGLEDDSP